MNVPSRVSSAAGLLVIVLAFAGATGCKKKGTCEYRHDEGSADRSIPQGLEVCLDGWVEDKCSKTVLSGATLGLKTSGYKFASGATCQSLGYKACSESSGTRYRTCPEELAKNDPLEKPADTKPSFAKAPEPTSLAAPIAVPSDAPFRGPANAKIVMQVFGDFQDPFSARIWPDLKDALKRHPDLKIVFRHNPLRFHKDAPLAHQASVEAFTQKGNEGFWAMHELISKDRRVDRASLVEYARTAHLDVAAFEKALDSGTHAARVAQDVKAAADAGIQSAPIAIIDTRIARGQQPPEKLEAFIAGKP